MEHRELTPWSAGIERAEDGRPLDRQLRRLDTDKSRRMGANEALATTTAHVISLMTDMNRFGVKEYARGVEGMVAVVEERGRSPMAQESIDRYARDRIDALADQTAKTIDYFSYQAAQKATQPMQTTTPQRSRTDKLLGRD